MPLSFCLDTVWYGNLRIHASHDPSQRVILEFQITKTSDSMADLFQQLKFQYLFSCGTSKISPNPFPFIFIHSKAFGGFSKSQMAVVVVAAAFPAAASQDMSVLRHVTLISFLSLAFMASLVVPWRRADDDPLIQNGRCRYRELI